MSEEEKDILEGREPATASTSAQEKRDTAPTSTRPKAKLTGVRELDSEDSISTGSLQSGDASLSQSEYERLEAEVNGMLNTPHMENEKDADATKKEDVGEDKEEVKDGKQERKPREAKPTQTQRSQFLSPSLSGSIGSLQPRAVSSSSSSSASASSASSPASSSSSSSSAAVSAAPSKEDVRRSLGFVETSMDDEVRECALA